MKALEKGSSIDENRVGLFMPAQSSRAVGARRSSTTFGDRNAEATFFGRLEISTPTWMGNGKSQDE